MVSVAVTNKLGHDVRVWIKQRKPLCSLEVGQRGSSEEKGTKGTRSGGREAGGRLRKLLKPSRQKARLGCGGGGCDNSVM